MSAQVRLRAGRLYLDAATSLTYLPQREAVTLFRRDDDLFIIPLQSAAGGYLLKMRTAAGDRVIDAEDFFREHGLDDSRERPLDVVWSAQAAALVASGAFCERADQR